jgi:hypothetical protein
MVPLVLVVLLIGVVALVWQGRLDTRMATAIAALLSFIAAGCSETFCSWQVTATLLAIGGVLATTSETRRRLAPVLLACLVAAVVGSFIVYLSPGVELRREALPAHPTLSALLRQTSSATRVFVVDAVLDGAVLVAGSVAFLLTLVSGTSRRLSAADYAFYVPVVVFAGLLLIAATIAPGFYALGTEPPQRVLPTAALSLTATFVVLGYLTALVLADVKLPAAYAVRGPVVLAVVLVAVLALPKAASTLSDERDRYVAWADGWDARDTELRAAKGQARSGNLTVRNVGPEVMGANPDAFQNRCFADYYDLPGVVTTGPALVPK